ncbi:hypothetical protein BO82DRAFT_436354 [Aspergillus uvarum CBS 121591]|uniref:Uncharacterized protein n=1 Tax=Aspergillus uvarum CBS 121591 TaxID=1448315 RepID=A0A319BX26_9EURO|nr:hypothetical protein BO82DRAFT_436354 [Aspergillus uvarum CBS 121591]PYH76757.1 hypothetical protein BO82DRAFT_436354 [Aspergillus uvarum CBS 121591]
MIEHQLAGMHSLLSSLLIREELHGLSTEEIGVLLATVLLLVLYDICESGISSHGVHLTGTAYICRKISQQPTAMVSSRTSFLIATLAWPELLRGFSGAEKLAFGEGTHQRTREFNHISLPKTIGCPIELFYGISGVINSGKLYLAGTLSLSDFEHILVAAERFFRTWDTDDEKRAALGDERKALAEAIPTASSPWFKRLLCPLFITGAETSVPHQQRFVEMCIGEIKRRTGFQHVAMIEIRGKVWEERS